MASEAAAQKKSNWLKIVIFVAIIAAVVIAVRQLGYMKYLQSPQLLKEAIDGLGFWGPVVFILLWVASAVFFLPGAALGIVGGILFGPWLGTFYTALGSTVGAVAAFLAGKYVARDMVKGLVEKNPKLQKIDEGVKKRRLAFCYVNKTCTSFPI